MLDSVTKTRINTARDILVGKVPDPKSQVEQITIALIYKFMDDMDIEAEELGGKRTFFSGEYAKYSWRKIFDPHQSGYELLNLYSEAITKMDTNPGVPKLFRDIFKNAYLPYRDPETLKSFLKIINEFEYTHSEKLGDAFEFLLSILGSQGDAGQFRTPRHIIDFMVEIVDPKKHEVILDPACGTAGFLISSYKHIIKQNSSNYVPDEAPKVISEGTQSVNEVILTTNGYSGDKLNADERRILADNMHGYDISPDMVRLSLVNMYLHGVKEPQIFEYDSLTSEDHWNEYSDVILANPPFMSPKGGIRPHKRFSVQSNRSEVLFVDYIVEHLTQDGRAAVIVPEGIIFQSGTAYKQLRKMLVEKYLVAVISLPAGVFQPYSGVKTSILWLDKAMAKKTDSILFVKIENDGFDLGAQRRSIAKNDLPRSLDVISNFKESVLRTQEYIPSDELKVQIIKRKTISSDNDFNLNSQKYLAQTITSSEHEFVTLGEVIDMLTDYTANGSFASLAENVEYKNSEDYALLVRLTDLRKNLENKDQIFVPKHSYDFLKKSSLHGGEFLIANVGANIGDAYIMPKISSPATLGPNMYLVKFNSQVLTQYVFILNKSGFLKKRILELSLSAAQPKINKSEFRSIMIPLPPPSVQEEIVAEIKSYQKVIDGARQIVENYKPRIDIDPEWDIVELGEVAKPQYGFTEKAKDQGDARFIRITDIGSDGKLITTNAKYIDLTKEAEKSIVKRNDILLARTGATFGKTMIYEEDYPSVFASFLMRLNIDISKIFPKYYWTFAQSENYIKQASLLMTGGGQPQFNGNAVVKIRLPLPTLDTQKLIVLKIEKEMELVNANKQLIEIFEQKIKDRIAKVWGEKKSEFINHG
jgi:type I restriction enzyme M protein